MIEWFAAAAVLLGFLSLLPRMLRRAKAVQRKSGGGSGVMMGIGLAFAIVLDPETAEAIEVIDRKQEDSEGAETGDKPAD